MRTAVVRSAFKLLGADVVLDEIAAEDAKRTGTVNRSATVRRLIFDERKRMRERGEGAGR
jgi:hypothetical protein